MIPDFYACVIHDSRGFMILDIILILVAECEGRSLKKHGNTFFDGVFHSHYVFIK